jgi:hypothetical protein
MQQINGAMAVKYLITRTSLHEGAVEGTCAVARNLKGVVVAILVDAEAAGYQLMHVRQLAATSHAF